MSKGEARWAFLATDGHPPEGSDVWIGLSDGSSMAMMGYYCCNDQWWITEADLPAFDKDVVCWQYVVRPELPQKEG